MKVEEALEDAKELEEVEEILDRGGYFCSAYIILAKDEKIEGWNLAFYSKENDKITAVKVTKRGGEVGVTDKPLQKTVHKIDPEEVGFGGEEALSKAKEAFQDEFGGSYKKILFSLHGEEGGIQKWAAVFLGMGLSVVSIEIDSSSGEILKKEKRGIGRRGSSIGG